MSEQDRPRAYRIGDLSLDLRHRQIRRNGEEIACGRLTFDLLALLAEAAPRVVSREELCAKLWDGRYVSPGTLKQRVVLLRQALGDQADEPRYILARARQHEWWSRMSRSILQRAVLQRAVDRPDLEVEPLAFTPVFVLNPTRLGRDTMLTASFSYARSSVADAPGGIQEAAAESILSDLDAELARLDDLVVFPL
jgi:hypothetical protein